ncbi:MAG: F0F1 ATP synthase subunit epsilon [Patescibacteria group bacterium]|nr:F0F1 ATP synthase subunit epsilon [Patescibacteria group bacterium]
MKLSIFSLKNVLYRGDAGLVNCQTTEGEITVLNNHKPLISVLDRGLVRVEDAEKRNHYFQVKGGFLEIKSTNEARLLVEE